MILTPPDVFSQTMLAVPMWVLFEVGLLACGWLKRPVPGKDIVAGV
jgi:sec-independent protein translocase protein TatC